MTDAEWIAKVSEHALKTGRYEFNRFDMERMRPYVRHVVPLLPGVECWSLGVKNVLDLADEMERGIAAAVTRKLMR